MVNGNDLPHHARPTIPYQRRFRRDPSPSQTTDPPSTNNPWPEPDHDVAPPNLAIDDATPSPPPLPATSLSNQPVQLPPDPTLVAHCTDDATVSNPDATTLDGAAETQPPPFAHGPLPRTTCATTPLPTHLVPDPFPITTLAILTPTPPPPIRLLSPTLLRQFMCTHPDFRPSQLFTVLLPTPFILATVHQDREYLKHEIVSRATTFLTLHHLRLQFGGCSSTELSTANCMRGHWAKTTKLTLGVGFVHQCNNHQMWSSTTPHYSIWMLISILWW